MRGFRGKYHIAIATTTTLTANTQLVARLEFRNETYQASVFWNRKNRFSHREPRTNTAIFKGKIPFLPVESEHNSGNLGRSRGAWRWLALHGFHSGWSRLLKQPRIHQARKIYGLGNIVIPSDSSSEWLGHPSHCSNWFGLLEVLGSDSIHWPTISRWS